MLRFLLLTLVCLCTALPLWAQKFAPINPQDITIVRDSFGVPHIYGPTDPHVAYGLAYAHAEDNFQTIQESLCMATGRMGELTGPDGAGLDFFRAFISCQDSTKAQYARMSPQWQAYLEAYAQGMNAYAAHHPKEVRLKGLFPVTGLAVAQGFFFAVTAMQGVGNALSAIVDNKPDDMSPRSKLTRMAGSNAFAISRNLSTTGHTTIVLNPHLPLEGPFTFYEAHLHSQEPAGLDVHGAVFPGMPVPGMGVTPHHGWALTSNWPDYADIFKLTVNPKNKKQYWFDGQWHTMTERTVKLRVKLLGFVKITVKKKIYETVYGPALWNKTGLYAVRHAQTQTTRAGEQWYGMAKAQSFSQFYSTIAQQHLPHFNIVYADKADTIFYVFNALMPIRNPNPAYNWAGVVPGDTSATLWNSYVPFKQLPQVLNPPCGYVYNTNNSPFHSSCVASNPDSSHLPTNLGMEWNTYNNRDIRFRELIYEKTRPNTPTGGKLTLQDIRDIKFDNAYPLTLPCTFRNIACKVQRLNPAHHPDIADALTLIRNWDYTGETSNTSAGLMLLAFYKAFTDAHYGFTEIEYGHSPDTSLLIKGVQWAKKQMLKVYGKLDVALGEVQRHIRGNVSLPMQGLPETLAAIYSELQPNAKLKLTIGETYIGIGQFDAQGLATYETLVPYGASEHPNSPHYTDQMQRFADENPKPVELDHAKVKQTAKAVYHPK